MIKQLLYILLFFSITFNSYATGPHFAPSQTLKKNSDYLVDYQVNVLGQSSIEKRKKNEQCANQYFSELTKGSSNSKIKDFNYFINFINDPRMNAQEQIEIGAEQAPLISNNISYVDVPKSFFGMDFSLATIDALKKRGVSNPTVIRANLHITSEEVKRKVLNKMSGKKIDKFGFNLFHDDIKAQLGNNLKRVYMKGFSFLHKNELRFANDMIESLDKVLSPRGSAFVLWDSAFAECQSKPSFYQEAIAEISLIYKAALNNKKFTIIPIVSEYITGFQLYKTGR